MNYFISVKKENEARGIRICIIDEATQATEADTLLPLIHGVKNIILVGDQQQLSPTVISEVYSYNIPGFCNFRLTMFINTIGELVLALICNI